MKTIYESNIGGDGGKAGVYIEGKDLAVKATIPVEKILEPAFKLIDSAIDKIEGLIPGDQKALAERLKQEARVEALELLTEQDAVTTTPEVQEGAPV